MENLEKSELYKIVFVVYAELQKLQIGIVIQNQKPIFVLLVTINNEELRRKLKSKN
uniref:Uncharacterized protein n=1 Tax=Meloidogyne enterolobii TaxID=390850 RepID=A0A6V7UPQ2_MELEN|nr:unnamed protein product [Meloidogyne enterolobii]